MAGGRLLKSAKRLKRLVAEGEDLSGLVLVGDFSEMDLSGADLGGTQWREAKLVGAKLAGADLSEAVLTDVNLSGADLRGASLMDAKLHGCRLAGAVLTGVSAERADFAGTSLERARLERAGSSPARAWLAAPRPTRCSTARSSRTPTSRMPT